MQVLFESGSESEGEATEGLGIIPGRVERFQTDLSVPHIGWNSAITRKKQLQQQQKEQQAGIFDIDPKDRVKYHHACMEEKDV